MTIKKISTLLVEDDKLAQKMGSIILKQLNCEVEAVATSKLALESINHNTYDIIFADIGLPDMDGFSLVRKIRDGETPNHQVPIIMLTANTDQETVKQSFEAGATGFFVKPLSKQMGEMILSKYLTS
jgi:CheY-like chemotaxis protein